MKETGNGYDSDAKYFYTTFMYDNYYGENLSAYALGLNKVYVLVTPSTASSSEAFVLIMRGLGLDVTLIGDEHTNGKNVGMESRSFEKGDYKYDVVPITFQYYNREKNTVPNNGFKVDYQVEDWNSGFVDFGEKHEPMLAKAIQLITNNSASSRSAMQVGNVQAKTLPMPEVKRRLQGAIVLEKE
jgi:C-terminal processing protease CtpA/Prc